jgi:hypothetical protein
VCGRPTGGATGVAQVGRSGGIGVFVDGAFLSWPGAECNARFPAVSPGVRCRLIESWPPDAEAQGGQMLEASVEANHWELFAFWVALEMFPDVFADQHVVLHLDSMSACRCADLCACLDAVAMAPLTRDILGQCVQLSCRLLPRHVSGESNVLADHLPRDRLSAIGREVAAWVRIHKGAESVFLLGL